MLHCSNYYFLGNALETHVLLLDSFFKKTKVFVQASLTGGKKMLVIFLMIPSVINLFPLFCQFCNIPTHFKWGGGHRLMRMGQMGLRSCSQVYKAVFI